MNYYEEIDIINPEDYPVSLLEAKTWLRVDRDITLHDPLITSLIVTATDFGEKATNRVFIQRQFIGFFDSLKYSNVNFNTYVELIRAPLISIESVEVSINGTYTEFTDYIEKKTSGFSRLIFPSYLTGVDSTNEVSYPLKVTFTVGYGPAADVPETLKTAIKQHVAFLYENSGDVAPDGKKGIPVEVRAMYRKYRIMGTF